MTIKVEAGGKSPPIQIPIGDWCRLCDALGVAPEATTQSVVEKAELLRQLLRDARSKASPDLPDSVNRSPNRPEDPNDPEDIDLTL